VESFVFVVYLMGTLRFALRVPQGWKSTAKSVEEIPSWSTVIRNRGLTMLLGMSMILTIIVTWGARYHFSRVASFHYFPTLFLAANLVACVFLYGREGRNAENTVQGASIDTLPASASQPDQEAERTRRVGRVASPNKRVEQPRDANEAE
jgi:hypothetical protein